MAPAKAKVAKKKTATKPKAIKAKVAKPKATKKVATKKAKTAKPRTKTTKTKTTKPKASSNKLVVRKAIPPPRQLTPKDSVIDLTIPEPESQNLNIHQMFELKQLMDKYNVSLTAPKSISVKNKSENKMRKSDVSLILSKSKSVEFHIKL